MRKYDVIGNEKDRLHEAQRYCSTSCDCKDKTKLRPCKYALFDDPSRNSHYQTVSEEFLAQLQQWSDTTAERPADPRELVIAIYREGFNSCWYELEINGNPISLSSLQGATIRLETDDAGYHHLKYDLNLKMAFTKEGAKADAFPSRRGSGS